jgi:hypothetical protein
MLLTILWIILGWAVASLMVVAVVVFFLRGGHSGRPDTSPALDALSTRKRRRNP